jgi:hypothetical protein
LGRVGAEFSTTICSLLLAPDDARVSLVGDRVVLFLASIAPDLAVLRQRKGFTCGTEHLDFANSQEIYIHIYILLLHRHSRTIEVN